MLERDTHPKGEKQNGLTESEHHCTIVPINSGQPQQENMFTNLVFIESWIIGFAACLTSPANNELVNGDGTVWYRYANSMLQLKLMRKEKHYEMLFASL